MIYTKTQETFKKLFDLKNGNNSKIVKDFQKEIDKIKESLDLLKKKNNDLIKENEETQETLKLISNQYDCLKELIKGKKTSDFDELNKQLAINFDPTSIRHEIDEKFPVKKSELNNKINTCTNDIKNNDEEITSLNSKIDELNLKLSTIIDKQKEISELLEKSINQDLLNFPPRPIIDTLLFLNFSEEEAKIIASNMVFSNPDFVNFYLAEERKRKEEIDRIKQEAKEVIARKSLTEVANDKENEPEEKIVTEVLEEKKDNEDISINNLESMVINVFKDDNESEEGTSDTSIINKLKEKHLDVNKIDNVDDYVKNSKTVFENLEYLQNTFNNGIDIANENLKLLLVDKLAEKIKYLMKELKVSKEEVINYDKLLVEKNAITEIEKLKENGINVSAISIGCLFATDNFISNLKTLKEHNYNISEEELLKYSILLSSLNNNKLKKYLEDYKVIAKYPQGNIYLNVFEVDEDIVHSNYLSIMQVYPEFIKKYPQFQLKNCEDIATIINTCKINNIPFQDENGSYYSFVFDQEQFKNIYPSVELVKVKKEI